MSFRCPSVGIVLTPLGFITGCPVGNIPTGTQVTLEVDPATASGRTCYLNRLSPNPQDKIQAGHPFNLIFNVPGVFQYEVECCEVIDPVSNPLDYIANLRQPETGMLSRTGFGQNVGLPTQTVFAATQQEIKDAVQLDDTLVLIDPSLSNSQMILSGGSVVATGTNSALSGHLAPGFEFFAPGGFIGIRNLASDFSYHCLTIDADPNVQVTAISHIRGFRVHYDHIEFKNVNADDSLSIGSSSSANLWDDITISNLRSGNENYGSVIAIMYDNDVAAGNRGKITLHSSYLGGRQRAPKNSGVRFHTFNNVAESVDFSWSDTEDPFGGGNPEHQTRSDYDVFMNPGGTNLCAHRSQDGVGPIYTDSPFYNNGLVACAGVIPSSDPSYNPSPIPYAYIPMTDEAQIVASVQATAGNSGNKEAVSSLLCETQECSISVN